MKRKRRDLIIRSLIALLGSVIFTSYLILELGVVMGAMACVLPVAICWWIALSGPDETANAFGADSLRPAPRRQPPQQRKDEE